MVEWRDIASVPRDGTLVGVTDHESGSFLMRWNPTGSNPLIQPEPSGIWEASDGSFTWSEQEGFGPTHWLPEDEYRQHLKDQQRKQLH